MGRAINMLTTPRKNSPIWNACRNLFGESDTITPLNKDWKGASKSDWNRSGSGKDTRKHKKGPLGPFSDCRKTYLARGIVYPTLYQSAKSHDLCVAFCTSQGASVRQRRAYSPLQEALPLFRHAPKGPLGPFCFVDRASGL